MALSPKEMEIAIIKNLPEKTGKSLEEWLDLLDTKNLTDKKVLVGELKEKHKVGHIQAQVIVNKFLKRGN